jgi:hypothetical protein
MSINIKNGDWVNHPGWSHGPVKVIDQNWALCAVAIQLGPKGGIVVWPMRKDTTPASEPNSLYSPTSISICFGGLKFLSWPVWLRKEFDVNDQGGRRAPQNGTGFDQESWMVRAAVVS